VRREGVVDRVVLLACCPQEAGSGSTARDVGVMLMTPGSSGKLEERQSPEGR